jgi:RNA polymerase sigma-70 factor (ECF subfamily)
MSTTSYHVAAVSDDFDDLLIRARRGDREALAAIWADLNPRLVSFLRSLAPGEAEDLASETWIGVAGALDRFTGDRAAFAAFVFTIARRRLADLRRAGSRRPSIAATHQQLVGNGPTGDAESEAMDDLAERELTASVRSLLPPAQSEVFFLRVVAGLDVSQTAEVLGKRPGAVRVLQHRALQALAELLPGPVADLPK